ncbi:23S rRNA (adenine(2030)-N(6))-methyltransferase RlmJ [Acuticoccus sediminis]|uniref:Ribosomal RNA large subunit methyltransferase J n=1 Tax=Acuticoccus sediminis TaxID=2184697 RepID=A0A8B2NX87_9HYPH|nr:23S rRNA (adenine(2030)-N(6))-methyltransferase RlmJ [Acuticoccus sediminis]RAI00317.1 23S rRNA (adenine(2030)-N(6))-methyltransferase RlmJ [Acuticoccus sediminis]
MNYRHAFHAGNHADVLKHVVLTRLLAYLRRKDKPFRVIDTHAGIGLYDLGAEEAVRSPEWRDGIARLAGATLPDDVAGLLAPYREAVAAVNEGERLLHYPGSPLIVQHMLREGDALEAIELHPVDHGLLVDALGRDRRVKVLHIDGWLALGAHLPPKERRGLVLVDPPYEEAADWDRLVDGLKAAHRRFAGGVYLLWYPLKAGAPVAALHRGLRGAGIPKVLAAELSVRGEAEGGLSGSGVIVVNPPFTLEGELKALLPALTDLLAQDGAATHRVVWLRGET